MASQTLNDKWFRFAGIPFIAFMGHIIFYNRNDSGPEKYGFWIIYLLSLAGGSVINYIGTDQHRQFIIRGDSLFLGDPTFQVGKRVLIREE